MNAEGIPLRCRIPLTMIRGGNNKDPSTHALTCSGMTHFFASEAVWREMRHHQAKMCVFFKLFRRRAQRNYS